MQTWDLVGNQGNSDKKDVSYLKFDEGQTIIRLLDTAPYSRWTHWLNAPANGGKGIGIECIGKGCPVCEAIKTDRANGVPREKMRYSSKMTHSINVLVKDEVKVLEQGNGIFTQIKNILPMLMTMGLPADLTQLDLVINRTGKGFNNTTYTVLPMTHKIEPLTEAQTKLEKYDLFKLKPELKDYEIVMLMNGKSLDEIVKQADAEATATLVDSDVEVDFTQTV